MEYSRNHLERSIHEQCPQIAEQQSQQKRRRKHQNPVAFKHFITNQERLTILGSRVVVVDDQIFCRRRQWWSVSRLYFPQASLHGRAIGDMGHDVRIGDGRRLTVRLSVGLRFDVR